MINAINNQNNSPNFKAIVPVKMVLVNNEVTRDGKQIKSAINHFINVLLKEDKLELKNSNTQNLNENMRSTFKSKIADYFIPQKYRTNSRDIGSFYGQKIRIVEGFKGHDYFILTGKDADKIDIASCKIKAINSKFKGIPANANKEFAMQKAKQEYGQIAQSLVDKADYDAPRIVIHGKKEKSGKITPEKIEF